jgi:ketosteroid isomerase-like protein
MMRTAEEVVREIYEGYAATGSVEDFFRNFADDAVLEESSWLPYGGSYRGKAAIGEAVGQIMTQHWRDFDIVINGYTGDAELVAVDLTLSAVGNKTGKPVKFKIIELWRVENGKVTWLRPIYGDYKQIREALDLA